MSSHKAQPLGPVPRSPGERDPEARLRRAGELLEQGGLADAAFWTRLAAAAIAETGRPH